MQQISLSDTFQIRVNNTYNGGDTKTTTSVFQNFMAWCNKQEDSWLLWLGVAILGGIATVLPIKLLAVVFLAQNDFTLWTITCFVNVFILIVNLAAQPQKIALPVLFFVWSIDASIIFYCFLTSLCHF